VAYQAWIRAPALWWYPLTHRQADDGPNPVGTAGSVVPLPQARRAGELPAASQREPPGGLHLHFHGLDAEGVAAIIERSRQDRP
jgi:hypothetical protein